MFKQNITDTHITRAVVYVPEHKNGCVTLFAGVCVCQNWYGTGTRRFCTLL